MKLYSYIMMFSVHVVIKFQGGEYVRVGYHRLPLAFNNRKERCVEKKSLKICDILLSVTTYFQ